MVPLLPTDLVEPRMYFEMRAFVAPWTSAALPIHSTRKESGGETTAR